MTYEHRIPKVLALRTATALALVLSPSAALAQPITYVNDRLTAAPTAGAAPRVTAGSRGGTFGPNGWTTTGPTDTIWWSIPATLPRGRFEVSATGLSIAASLTGQEHDLIGIYGQTDRAEPVAYNPWYRNNEFKFIVRVFGALNTCSGCQAVGSSKLELALCPALSPLGYTETTCPASCVAAGYDFWQAYLGPRGRGEPLSWDAATTYRFVITWEPGRATYSRGGPEGTESLTFPGEYAPRELRVRIGPPSSERGPDVAMPRNVTFSNAIVQGEPGAATPSCNVPVDSGIPDSAAPLDSGSGTPRVIELPAIEDVTVDMGQPSMVFADVRDLSVERTAEAYIKFRLGSLPGRVTRAELLLQTAMTSSAAGSGASVFRAASDGWSETTLTYAARPGTSGARLARIGPTMTNMAYSADVTAAITGSSTVAFALVQEAMDNDGVHFDSKEVSPARGPRLRLTIDPTMPPADAGVAPMDSGVREDAGALAVDARVAVDARRMDVSTGGGTVDGGCGCRATTNARPRWAALAAAIAAVSGLARRRDRRRPRS
ncbi:MAG: DNRLRE domain-containing protein [Deltaproteobacteria bacterium]|nr:DNRLRE domain-containing protein [Deltaproteobacteria bacterium]